MKMAISPIFQSWRMSRSNRECARPAPMIPPIRAWDTLIGIPHFVQACVHRIAPTSAARTSICETDSTLRTEWMDFATAVPNTKAATKFQDDHKRHNDALIATIRKLGGEPGAEKAEAEYAKALNFDRLKNQEDVLDLAARLELGATNAYLGVIPAFKDPQLAKVAGRLAADEATHWALLNFDLGRPFMAALGFGA